MCIEPRGWLFGSPKVIEEDGAFYTVAGERLYAEVDVEQIKQETQELEEQLNLRVGALEKALVDEKKARQKVETEQREAMEVQQARTEYVKEFEDLRERFSRARAVRSEQKGDPDG